MDPGEGFHGRAPGMQEAGTRLEDAGSYFEFSFLNDFWGSLKPANVCRYGKRPRGGWGTEKTLTSKV